MDKSFTKNLKNKDDLKFAISQHFELTPRINSVIDIRYKEIKEYIDNLNYNCKFQFITGFSGVGKSEILKFTPAFLNNSLFFSFDCFKSACIDDVIFSLYRYFTTIKSVKVQQLIKRTFSQSRSIDERIIDLLTEFPVNLVIAFDSFENFINKNTDRLPHEIAKFLDFLAEQENIKVITVSNAAPFEIIKKYPFSKTLRLDALDFSQFIDLKQAMHVTETDAPFDKILEETLGVPRYIRAFFKATKDENMLSFFQKATSQKSDFNSFVASQLINKLPTRELETLYYLAALRHPVTRETIDSILPDENKKHFTSLLKTSFIYNFDGQLSVKDFFKTHLEAKLGKTFKEKVHSAIVAFYEKEIPLKHFERHIKLSRTTLRNELAYHARLCENKKSSEIAMRASMMNSDVIMYNDTQTLTVKEDYEPKPKEKNSSEKVLQKAQNMAVQNMSTHHLTGMEFSEEERHLLYEEAKELEKGDERRRPKEKKKAKTIIDEIPIDVDYKKSKIVNSTSYYKLLENGIDNEEKKNFAKAVEFYSQATKNCPHKDKELYIHTKIAHCNTKLKKRTEAMDALKAAYTIATELDDNKKIAYVLLHIARTLQAFGEYKLAEQHYNDFLDMDALRELPKGQILFALLGLGDLYIDMNKEDSALTVYQTALKQAGVNHPVLNEIYFKIALTFDNMGKIQQAKDFYERGAMSILVKEDYDKYYSESCANLGLIYSEEGDNSKAIELLCKSYDNDKNANELEAMVQSASRIASVYFDMKDYKSAQKYYYEKLQAAKELNTPYLLASAYLDIGDVYIRSNNLAKALRAFILAKKSIGSEISTDSKVKIDRRIEFIKSKLDPKEYAALIGHHK